MPPDWPDGMGPDSDCIAKPSEALEGTWGPAAPTFLPTTQSQPDPPGNHGEEAERPGVSVRLTELALPSRGEGQERELNIYLGSHPQRLPTL